MRWRGLVVAALVLAHLCVAPRVASAEWFLDLYLGGAFTAYDDLDSQFGSTLQLLEDVEYDASFLLGGRFGYWFDSPIPNRLHIGVGADVSWFEANIDAQTVEGIEVIGPLSSSALFTVLPMDISIIAVSLDLMFRFPLMPSPDFPRGRLTPYLTAGPAVFFTEIEDSQNFSPPGQSDRETTVGFKVGTGVAWSVVKNFAVFGEWRFTYFSPEWRFTDNGVSGKLETDITTFHFLVGASLRF